MTSHIEEKLRQGLESSFFMPSWWVRGFAAAYEGEKDSEAWCQAFEGGISPEFTPAEAAILPTLLASFQSEVLIGNKSQEKLSLVPGQLEQQIGLLTENRRKSLGRVVQGVGGLRLFAGQPVGGRQALSLFGSELRFGQTVRDFFAEFELLPHSCELLLGYLDGYRETDRRISGRQPLSEVMPPFPPLIISRPLWCELSLLGQAVFLNLEKAVQWFRQCFSLEGVFGESLDKLFGFERNLASEKKWSCLRKIKYLSSLTQKLTEHGTLSRMKDEDYLAFHAEEGAAQLLWKLSPERLRAADSERYRDAVCLLFEARGGSDFSKELWVRSLIPENRQSLCSELGFVSRMLQEMVASEPVRQRYIILTGNQLIPVYKLFIEWSLRTQFPDQDFPVPDLILKNLSDPLPDSDAPTERWKASFISFQKSLPAILPFMEEARQDPRGAFIGDCFSKKNHDRPVLPARLPIREGGRSDSRCLESTQGSVDYGAMAPEQAKKTDRMRSPVKGMGRPAVRVDEKSESAEKIKQIRKGNRKAYLELLNGYLTSLDDGARQLISDIRARMQPEIFEQHMHHRLVRFVMQDYQSWIKRLK